MRKFSNMSTDEAFDTICEITPYASSIMSDQDIMDGIGKGADRKNLTAVGMVMLAIKRVASVVPALLKNHRADIYGIVAVMHEEDKTPEDIAKQGIMVSLAQFQEVMQDKILIDFFKSWRRGGTIE